MEAEEEAATARHRAGRGASSGYNAVGLSYGDEPEEPDQAPEELYVPRFEVPRDLSRLLRGVTETGHKVGSCPCMLHQSVACTR